MTNEVVAGWYSEFVRTLIIYKERIKPPVGNYANHIKKHPPEKDIKRSNNKNEKMLNLSTGQRYENEDNYLLIRLTVGEIVGILVHLYDIDGSTK